MRNKITRSFAWLTALLLVICLSFTACDVGPLADKDRDGEQTVQKAEAQEQTKKEKSLGVPKYSGTPYAKLNNNKPKFADSDITDIAFEKYSKLDSLGRCGVAVSCVGIEIMPTEDRESISSVKPSGWVNNKYDSDLVDGGYIYNRCHLIGFQLTGENANKQNLITGTRYMNVEGMLPFENMIADYVKETENHVMYRVTPIYDGDDLVACGVQLEAYSVEDGGEEICFNVYVYNIQPGIVIDYTTGENWLSGKAPVATKPTVKDEETDKSADGAADGSQEYQYILTTGKKIHLSDCSVLKNTKEENKKGHNGALAPLINQGYSACGICKPDKQ